MRFGGHEEGAAGFEDVVGIGVAVRFGHGTQGLKPKVYFEALRHDWKSCPDT
jgi:hypothetical protein